MIPKVAILVSGSGTNMENLIQKMQVGEISAEAVVVIGDRKGIASKERAEKLKLPYVEIERKLFSNKAAFEKALQECLNQYHIDWILLAGFMRILSDEFVLQNWGKIINIHPSFLPAFPGAHGIKDAFDAKVSETGVTVHFVDTGVDSGKVIWQERVPILPEDTLESLEARVHAEEYKLYPKALNMLFKGEVELPRKT